MALIDYRERLTCTRCGQCRHFIGSWARSCPSGTKYVSEPFYSSGRAWLAEALVEERVELDRKMAGTIYSCAMCRACTEMCPIDYQNHAMDVVEALREEAIEAGMVPPTVRDFLKNINTSGNPWKEPQEARGDWAEGTEIRPYEKGDEFLYYVGCVGAYDERSQVNARAVGELLLRAGCSFGILGSEEVCDGNEVKHLGERGLYEHLVQEQSRIFMERGVKKVVTLSPHAFHTMRNDYPTYGIEVEVMHYTQLLRDLIETGELDVSKGFSARVTLHDPCYLGRWNQEFEVPRQILAAIPGIELVEMERNRETAFCCGGGGGNFATDLLSGQDGPACLRVREANETGADLLAVACPICTKMLSDALKTEGLEEALRLADLSEIVLEACK
jgi:Fe-S oxidoreductase